MKFEKVKLGDVCTVITDGSHSSPKASEIGFPMLSVKDMKEFDFNYEGSKIISVKDYNELVKNGCQPLENDVLIAKDGNSCLEYCFVFRESREIVLLSSIAILRPDMKIVNPYYLMYYLGLESTKRELRQGYLSGSAIPRVVLKDFRMYPINLPPLTVQNQTVNLIKSINLKIELNQSIISNFEELAQTLFKRWFVDFEFPNEDGKPYKSSGGKMVESELGMMPEGWEIGTLNDIGKIVGGGTPSKKVNEYYTKDGYSWLTPKDLSTDKSIYQYKGAIDITEEGLRKGSAKLHPENTVLFSSRAPIGYIAIAGKAVSTNQGFKSIIPAEKFSSEYVYLLLKYITPIIESNASGSTFKEISGKGMKNIKTILPPQPTLEKFHQIISNLFKGIQMKEKESKSLIEHRDTLLPKLLSGKVDLN